ncbi:MAG: GTP cyclohydrolase II [Pseudomonadota bacterium]
MTLESLMPNRTERVNRARNELAMGMPSLVKHGYSAAICVALETVTEDRFFALKEAIGTPTLVISPRRARAIMSEVAAANLGDSPVRIRPPETASFHWYQRLANPKFDREAGPAGPLHLLRSGDSTLHDAALRLVKSVELLPAVALFPVAADERLITDLGLLPLEAADALADLADELALEPVAAARLPLEVHHDSELHVFRAADGQREHYAIEIGRPNRTEPVLSRLHSACFTGDILGSLKCDCGPQLRAALAQMGEEGAGVLLYLNQEGRGIGLGNKMRVYDLQSHGLDTVEANHQLGYEDDERDFRLAATMLKTLGFDRVRLLTNNPGKVDRISSSGVTVVERIPLRVGETEQNQNYLATKARKSGHFL